MTRRCGPDGRRREIAKVLRRDRNREIRVATAKALATQKPLARAAAELARPLLLGENTDARIFAPLREWRADHAKEIERACRAADRGVDRQ